MNNNENNAAVESQTSGMFHFLLGLAAFVVIVAGMHQAQTIIVPFLLSVFIAIISTPVLFFLEKRGVPKLVSFLIVLLGVIVCIAGIVLVIGASASSFMKNLPEYQEKLNDLLISAIQWARAHKIPVSQSKILENLDPALLMGWVGSLIGGIGAMLSKGLLIFITTAFIIFETSTFPDKVEKFRLKKSEDDEDEPVKRKPNVFITKIKHYLAIKTATSLLTAVLVAVGLLAVGVDYPFLWGLLAFFLNFIPSIGAILAAIPVLLLTLIQFGVWTTLWVGVGYTALNIFIGNFVEPNYMGKELGLSPLVVFLSLVFWGWLLGPIGMLLSVPLTMTAKIACDSRKETKWIGVLLGP
ncbi:MAG: AI-2E family transporter [Kiritimatiellaeota bacterium]|nr:AI-2E family transporter [Kiritimatiellota bacterium]